MELCNYRCSDGSYCYYEPTFDEQRCYFHGKVEARLITGYYENLTAEDRDSRWVNL